MKVKGLKNDIQGLIFDMDGLLVDSEKLYWQANVQAAHEFNLNIPDDSYLKLIGASNEQMEKFYHQYFPNHQVRDEFIKRTDEIVWQWSDQGKLKLRPGVQKALDFFDEQNLKMGMASSNYQKVVDKFVWLTGIRQYFKFRLSYKDVLENQLKPKPAPDIYLMAQEKLALPKENLLIFEDSSTGVMAAKNAGINCVMIPDLKEPTAADKEYALIYDSFDKFLSQVK
ncbi:HAD family hydrolase [Lactobacillus sp. PV034]|uniref:HAD family hydrolase n=1 Tax=Lactobacillus sp. PV034 TaxID=2594495 RepID=UPI00223F747E|nr:HAD family phosphatase [Lactobacillus sp. PV034]QNQ80621.1 HAD family phosphatase [Lactobacillus sp. PV034]